MKKWLVSILLIIMFTMSIGLAEETVIQPRWSNIARITCNLSIDGGTANYSGYTYATSSGTTTNLRLSLVRRADDSNLWFPVATWTTSSSGTSIAFLGKTATVQSGYTYYAYAYVEVVDANGTVLESDGIYSQFIHY